MRIIAVTSGKGGVGKTSLSANIGIAMAQAKSRVVLFDADLQLANVDVALGLTPEFSLQHVVAEQQKLVDVLTEGPEGLKVVTGGSAISSLMNAGPKRMATFFDQFEELAEQTDILIFDTGAGLDNRVLRFFAMSDELVLVTTPDPTAVTDAYATAKIAFRRKPDAKISVIVNMVRSEAEGQAVFQALSDISWNFLKKHLDYLGSVHEDQRVSQAIRKRVPFVVSAPECQAAQDVQAIAKQIRKAGITHDLQIAG